MEVNPGGERPPFTGEHAHGHVGISGRFVEPVGQRVVADGREGIELVGPVEAQRTYPPVIFGPYDKREIVLARGVVAHGFRFPRSAHKIAGRAGLRLGVPWTAGLA